MQKFDQSPYYAAVVNHLKFNGTLIVIEPVNMIISRTKWKNEPKMSEEATKLPT